MNTMEHQALLRAVEACDCSVFTDWYEKAQSRNNLAVKEAFNHLSKKELTGIWAVFAKWVNESVKVLAQVSGSADEDQAGNTLLIMSIMALQTIDSFPSSEPNNLGPAIEAMNQALLSDVSKKAGLSICQMCEKYWTIHVELEMRLSVNVINWYLAQALQPKAKTSSIKYVWGVCGSLKKMDPNILESSGILKMLISCSSNSKFLSSPDGRKCIACLFHFGPNIVQMLHQSIKKYIPISNISDCESLGDVYFRAWRTTLTEECRADVEFSIQDLMYNAVVAFRKPLGAVEGGTNKVPMNKLLFHLLHAIHRQKKQRTFAILIHSLYKPILWRYLEASNGLVRANALCLFFDAFPFESGEGVDEDEAVRKKQWAIMLSALMDPVPLVRTIAIQGTCRVLAEYWVLVPIHIVQEFITCMLRKLLHDSSSPDVRAHVIKGLNIMLESKQTHALLEKMIPVTNKVLHDPHEKVRTEYVALLAQIKKLGVSKLWEVIDVNHLVIRLAVDTSKNVCRHLVNLLAPFYHPKSQSEIVFGRCLRLVIENREASRKFYQHIHSCVSIQQMTELILVIWKFLRNHIRKLLEQNRLTNQREEVVVQHQRSRAGTKRSRLVVGSDEAHSSSVADEDKENQQVSSDSEEEQDEDTEQLNESNILGLLDVVCILLSVNKTKFKTPQNLVYWENIKTRFNKTCSLFFRYFRNSDGLRTLIYLYGLLSSTSSPMMLSFVKSQLKSLDNEATAKDFSHLVDVMCNWNRGEDLLEFICEHVQNSLTAQQPADTSVRSTRGNRKKRVSFEKLSDDKPLLGLRCMAYILQNPNNKKVILRKNLAQVEQLSGSLKRVMALAESDHEKLMNQDHFLYAATTLYVKVTLVLTSFYKREEETQANYIEIQESLNEILNWTNRMMLVKDEVPTLETLVTDILSSFNNLIMIHTVQWNVCLHFLTTLRQLLSRFPKSTNLILAMKSALYSLDYLWNQRSIGNECDSQCDEHITLLIKKTLKCFCVQPENKKLISDDDWPLMRDIIRKILDVCRQHSPSEHQGLRDTVLAFADMLISEMIDFQPDPENQLKNIKNLPVATSAIVAAFHNRNLLAKMLLDEYFESFSRKNEVNLLNLGSITKLVEVLSQNRGQISTATLIQAVASIELLFDEVAELEKNANEKLVVYINTTVQVLKQALNMNSFF